MSVFRPFKSAVSGAAWITVQSWNALMEALERDRAVLAAGTGDEIPTNSGRVLHVIPGTGGGSALGVFPFKVMVKNFGDTDHPDWGRIVLPGLLFKSDDATDLQTITGLAASEIPTGFDPGWANTSTTDEVWMEGTFGTWPALSGVTIKSAEIDDDFDGGENEHDGGISMVYTQTKFRRRICTMADDGDGNVIIDEQFLRNDLQLFTAVGVAVDSTASDPQTIALVRPYTP